MSLEVEGSRKFFRFYINVWSFFYRVFKTHETILVFLIIIAQNKPEHYFSLWLFYEPNKVRVAAQMKYFAQLKHVWMNLSVLKAEDGPEMPPVQKREFLSTALLDWKSFFHSIMERQLFSPSSSA